MAWSQHTFPLREAAQGDDVADLHRRGIDYHPIDEQLDDGTALLGGRVLEAGIDGGAERLGVGGQGL